MPYRHYEKWRARWLDETGKQCSQTFDDKKEATHHEQKMKAKVGEIKRGLRRADPPAKTFADLTAEWLATRALAKRSKKDDESMLRRHLTPAFGALQLREVLARPLVDPLAADLAPPPRCPSRAARARR